MSKFMSFYEWLSKEKNRHSPLGDLASEVLRDQDFPKDITGIDALLTYLKTKQATGVTLATARLAWQTYSRGQKK